MDKAVEALGLNLPQLIAQIANFAVLLLILRLTLYKPVLRMLDERKQKIAEGLNAAELARAEAASAQVTIQAQIDAAPQTPTHPYQAIVIRNSFGLREPPPPPPPNPPPPCPPTLSGISFAACIISSLVGGSAAATFF